ncbi:MAG TPA: hypothetical protein VIF84_06705 [Candidatus Limnocylindrales bacterium]
MASKDRPHREAKKKPKDKSVKPGLTSLGDAPPPQAELIKPKRKPRWDDEDRTPAE